LSDPQRRNVYDQLGEQGLKERPSPETESPSGFYPRSAEDIFAEFFGSSPLNFGSSGPGRSKRFPSDGGAGNGGFSGDFNSRTHSERANTPKKPPPVETKLPCSLEELYSGSTRKMKISRTVVDSYGYVSFIIVWILCKAAAMVQPFSGDPNPTYYMNLYCCVFCCLYNMLGLVGLFELIY
jgi:DnaJ homolog subfamily B member 4